MAAQPPLHRHHRVVGGRTRRGQFVGQGARAVGDGRWQRQVPIQVWLGSAGQAHRHVALIAQRLLCDLCARRDHGVHRALGQHDVGAQGAVGSTPHRTVEDDLGRAIRGEDEIRLVDLDEIGLHELLGVDARRQLSDVAICWRHVDDRSVGRAARVAVGVPEAPVERGERLPPPEVGLGCTHPHDDVVREWTADRGVQRLGKPRISAVARVGSGARPATGSVSHFARQAGAAVGMGQTAGGGGTDIVDEGRQRQRGRAGGDHDHRQDRDRAGDANRNHQCCACCASPTEQPARSVRSMPAEQPARSVQWPTANLQDRRLRGDVGGRCRRRTDGDEACGHDHQPRHEPHPEMPVDAQSAGICGDDRRDGQVRPSRPTVHALEAVQHHQQHQQLRQLPAQQAQQVLRARGDQHDRRQAGKRGNGHQRVHRCRYRPTGAQQPRRHRRCRHGPTDDQAGRGDRRAQCPAQHGDGDACCRGGQPTRKGGQRRVGLGWAPRRLRGDRWSRWYALRAPCGDRRRIGCLDRWAVANGRPCACAATMRVVERPTTAARFLVQIGGQRIRTHDPSLRRRAVVVVHHQRAAAQRRRPVHRPFAVSVAPRTDAVQLVVTGARVPSVGCSVLTVCLDVDMCTGPVGPRCDHELVDVCTVATLPPDQSGHARRTHGHVQPLDDATLLERASSLERAIASPAAGHLGTTIADEHMHRAGARTELQAESGCIAGIGAMWRA